MLGGDSRTIRVGSGRGSGPRCRHWADATRGDWGLARKDLWRGTIEMRFQECPKLSFLVSEEIGACRFSLETLPQPSSEGRLDRGYFGPDRPELDISLKG